MHELSIAMGIVQIAEKEAKKAQVDRVLAIDLEIGTLSGVEIEALNFAWPMAVAGSVLQMAEKRIHLIEAQAKCLDCGTDFKMMHFYDTCPICGSPFKNIYKGKELRVKSLEV